jgi:hypothetical protein
VVLGDSASAASFPEAMHAGEQVDAGAVERATGDPLIAVDDPRRQVRLMKLE